jgi:hypothetical protein
MSFITTSPLGAFSNENSFIGPTTTAGGNFQCAAPVSVGSLALVCVTVQGGGTVAATDLNVADTKGNTYTKLAELDFGGNLLAIFGSAVTTGLGTEDYVGWNTSGQYIQTGFGTAVLNATLTVDFIETGTGSGSTPPAVMSGAPNATYGDAIFGFVGASSGFGLPSAVSGPNTWDAPIILGQGLPLSLNEGGGGSSVYCFGAETFAKTAQNFAAQSTGEGSTFGVIVLGLRAQSVSGALAAVEYADLFQSPTPAVGTFFFHWVDADEDTFHQTFAVVDEDIFSSTIKHDEGQVCTLELVIQNPRIGLLNPGRKLWAWFSQQTAPGVVTPLFFGVLIGIPSNIFQELVTLKFNARPSNYIEAKQAVAEKMKVAPYYDPIFLDEAHRDDADAILEGYSSLWHIDRVTLETTASDILEGEDGTLTFDESTNVLYDSVTFELGECPLDQVQVQADVKWTQRCIGYIAGPSANISSYTGGSFKSDWPKPGSNIGGGWKVEFSYVNDVLDTDHARTYSTSSHWTNPDPSQGDCAIQSMSYSATYSLWPGISIEGTGARSSQTGICDPYAYASFSATTPGVNIPAKTSTSGSIALLWILNCTWGLRYDAKRDFTETVTMNIGANLQSTLASPTVDQNTALIKVSGADVGLPLVTPDAWSDFAGILVENGQIIFPNDPTTPGGKSYQVCVGSGVAGTTEPVFSDTPGTLTYDGGVVWASLGDSTPSSQPEWTSASPVGIGEIYIIEPKVWSDEDGDMQTTGASSFLLCLKAGHTNGLYYDFEYLPAVTSSDEEPALPVPAAVIVGPGDVIESNLGGSAFGPLSAPGGTFGDGSVVWMNLGTAPQFLGIPIGGTMLDVTANNFFPSDRGQQSIQYLVMKARAMIRHRARCIKITWDAPYEQGIGLSCRQNATLYDTRLPGGVATGKITSYTLTADKDGKLLAHVEIGVCVGLANSVPDITGAPEYTAATGYALPGYQKYDGGQYTIGEEDVAYTPPAYTPFDDGLLFPLQYFPGTLTILRPIQDPDVVTALAALSSPQLGNTPQVVTGAGDGSTTTSILESQSVVDWLSGGQGTYAIECNPVAAEILIQPVTNGPFNGAYSVSVTNIELPKGIDLEAASSP